MVDVHGRRLSVRLDTDSDKTGSLCRPAGVCVSNVAHRPQTASGLRWMLRIPCRPVRSPAVNTAPRTRATDWGAN